FEYVDDVNPNLVCCVCYAPFLHPLSAPCGHTFCRTCITRALATTSPPSCPVDRSLLAQSTLLPADQIVRALVDELRVKCPSSPPCEWSGERHLARSHVDRDCQEAWVTCSLGCGAEMRRSEEVAHLTAACALRRLVCERCGDGMGVGELESHEETCPREPSTCPHCNYPVPRAALPTHLDTCPSFPTPCTHARHGCPWEGARSTLPTHLDSCALHPLRAFIAEVDSRLAALTDENRALRTEVADLRAQIATTPPPPPPHPPHPHLPPPFPEDILALVTQTAKHMEQLAAEPERVDTELSALSAGLVALELKQEALLAQESARLRGEMAGVRGLCQALQMQL
ncbi:hypothetical protein BDK51DRAFT_11346, partial [Blyttiomyces helicus]